MLLTAPPPIDERESARALTPALPAPPTLRLAVVTETYPPEVNGVSMTLARFVEGLRQRQHHVQMVRPVSM